MSLYYEIYLPCQRRLIWRKLGPIRFKVADSPFLSGVVPDKILVHTGDGVQKKSILRDKCYGLGGIRIFRVRMLEKQNQLGRKLLWLEEKRKRAICSLPL